MARDISESDWKAFRQIREEALNRFCQRVLDELARIAADPRKSPHERYLSIWKVMRARDQTLGEAFNDPRRSTAFSQMLSIHGLGLFTEAELGRFSEATRALIAQFSS
jgi:hypothetical protein